MVDALTHLVYLFPDAHVREASKEYREIKKETCHELNSLLNYIRGYTRVHEFSDTKGSIWYISDTMSWDKNEKKTTPERLF